jgi:hypothetical protein
MLGPTAPVAALACGLTGGGVAFVEVDKMYMFATDEGDHRNHDEQ